MEALRDVSPNIVAGEGRQVKRKREETVSAEKKIRMEGRVDTLDDAQAFLDQNECALVTVTACWESELSEVAKRVAEGAPGVRHVTLDTAADESGEVVFEMGVRSAPCIQVYRSRKLVGTVLPKHLADETTARVELTALLGLGESSTAGAETMEVDGMPPKITSTDHFNQEKAEGLTVFDFFATWCKPCLRIAPHLPDLARDYPHMKFFKVDRDEHLTLHKTCGVEKIPTFQVYRDGRLIDSLQHSDHTLIRGMLDKYVPTTITFDEDF